VLEQTVGPAPLLAPLELLAWAAGCTDRLRLGVAVLVASLYDPVQLASAITAVDRISHGRLDVGVAPGGGRRRFAAFGVDGATFISSFTEGLQLMKAAWSDAPRVTFDGRFRHVDDLPIQSKPVQRPHPPIWFGGQARERVLAGLHRIYGSMPGVDNVPVSGTVSDLIAGLREVIYAGAETILLNPVGRDVAEDREQMERLAAEVIPQLR
jgi:hypothetical protein